jgi:protein subunit release factor A
MEKIVIEIRASEGGDDSKLLVKDLADIYVKSCRTNGYSFKIEERESFASI